MTTHEQRKKVRERFTKRDNSTLPPTDVLIASQIIGTGVDGLQKVCRVLVVNLLPMTHAEWHQLRG